MNLEKEIFDISLVDIMPNRFQPREIFDDEALKELSASIKEHGVIQPIIVRKVGDKYEIIAGERRFRASQLAGKESIPALVRDIDDKEAAKIALLENLQRKDLTPIEEAKTYQTILKLDNMTQEELAQNLGKSQSAIANKLRLLNLDEEVQTALLNSQISERHARSLLSLDNQKQKELLIKIINNRLTVRQVDEEIMKITGKIPEVNEEDINVVSSFENNIGQEAINLNNNPSIISEPIIATPDKDTYQNNINENINNQNNYSIQNSAPIVEPVINNQPVEFEIPQNNFYTELGQENMEMPKEIIQNQTVNTNMANNIFDKLRINNEQENKEELNTIEVPELNQTSTIINSTPEQSQNNNYNNIYDLRFAINNFRQAIQNTEKFGFKVKAEEFDNPDSYQIVIKIDKNS